MQGLVEPIDVRRAAIAIAIAAVAGFAALAVRGSLPAASAGVNDVEEISIGNFDQPIYVENAPGFKDLLFVVEKEGVVEVLKNEVQRPQPFLDISNRVATDGEQGLLSIAFASTGPADYKKSRRFYVYYTNNNGDLEIDEFKRRKGNPLRASESSRRRVLKIPHPGVTNHNGGTLLFGIHGRMYLATGDGANANNAGDLDSLLGKILRLRPIPGGNPNRNGYGQPSDNPLVGKPGHDLVWAWGFRNPFRWSFDPERAALAVGDVGAGTEEEVTFLTLADARESNFGWPEWEGNAQVNLGTPGPGPHQEPTHSYPHAPGPTAVTGGVVMHDPDLPAALDGDYVFADFYGGDLMTFEPDLANNEADNLAPLGVNVPQPSSFATGVGGQVYVSSLTGPVYRLEPVP